jgi:hypothetical protein
MRERSTEEATKDFKILLINVLKNGHQPSGSFSAYEKSRWYRR